MDYGSGNTPCPYYDQPFDELNLPRRINFSSIKTDEPKSTKNLNLNYVLAFITAGFATFSIIKADGSHWTQLLAILVFAPVSVLGGLFYLRRNEKQIDGKAEK